MTDTKALTEAIDKLTDCFARAADADLAANRSAVESLQAVIGAGYIVARHPKLAPMSIPGMVASLDRQLMNEVHESRAARRQRRCVECDDPVADDKAHWKINEGPCMILPAAQIDPDTAEATYTPDIHTMEATA